jgi:phosphate transport system permease protein
VGFDGKNKTRKSSRNYASKEVSETIGLSLTFEDLKPILVKITDYFKRFFSPEGLTALCAFSSLIITSLILFFLFQQAYPLFQKMGYGQFTLYLLWQAGYSADTWGWLFTNGNILSGFLNFLTGSTWLPSNFEFGALPLIESTFIVVVGAVAIAFPIGIFSAVHLAEYCSLKVKTVLKTIIEMLAGIPSVVFGLVGLMVVVPAIKNWLLSVNSIWNYSQITGLTALAASIILAIMILPTIISISEDAISAVPSDIKEASFALGATHFQTVRRVILPSAAAGIAASVVLAVGRAVGETMAVLMVSGNAPFSFMPSTSNYLLWYYLQSAPDQIWQVIAHVFLVPVYPMTAVIASEIFETTWGSTQYQALLALGFVLFAITYIINFSAERIIFRFSRKFKRRV